MKIVAVVGDAVQQSCHHGDMLIHIQSPLLVLFKIPGQLTWNAVNHSVVVASGELPEPDLRV